MNFLAPSPQQQPPQSQAYMVRCPCCPARPAPHNSTPDHATNVLQPLRASVWPQLITDARTAHPHNNAPVPAQQGGQQQFAPGKKPPAECQLGDDKAILVTGCQSFETSADACPGGDKGKAYGALSNAIQTAVRQLRARDPSHVITNRRGAEGLRAPHFAIFFSQAHLLGWWRRAHRLWFCCAARSSLGYLSVFACRELVTTVRATLARTGFAQNPCLECSERNADRPFIC